MNIRIFSEIVRRTLPVAAFVVLAAPLGAQDAPRTISYDEAIDIALRESWAVVQAGNAAALRSLEVTEQQMQFLPTVRLTTSGGASSGRTFQADEGGIVTETTRSMNLGVTAGMTLFDGFRNVAALQVARLSSSAAEMDVDWARRTAVMTVAADFLALVEGEEQLRVRTEALAAQESELRQVEQFVEGGRRPIADLYQQQANVAAARADLVEAERARDLASMELVSLLELDPAGAYSFVAPPVEVGEDASGNVLETLIDRALDRRPDLQATRVLEDAAEQQVRMAGAAWWPTVSLSAGYNTGASSTSALTWVDQLDQRRGGSLTLSVSVPVFDGMQASTQSQAAHIQLADARYDVERQSRQVELEVRRAWVDEGAARERLDAAEARLEAAERALDATSERYRAGAATLLDVSQARAAQVEAASGLVTARHTLVLQRTLIEFYAGGLDVETTASRLREAGVGLPDEIRGAGVNGAPLPSNA